MSAVIRNEGIATELTLLPEADLNKPYEVATFAGGCFWGVEKFFRYSYHKQLRATAVGYQGGSVPNPLYKAVKTGTTGHAEAVQIEFYPDLVSYAELVEYFYRCHDPTTLDRQEADVGSQYRSVIFAHSEEQKKIAEEITAKMQAKWTDKGKIVTQIVIAPRTDFYFAEVYHQVYLEKNPGGWCVHKLRFCAPGEDEYPQKPEGYVAATN